MRKHSVKRIAHGVKANRRVKKCRKDILPLCALPFALCDQMTVPEGMMVFLLMITIPSRMK
jgi:hypothetical protein